MTFYRILLAGLVFMLTLFSQQIVQARLYSYTDDEGKVWYVASEADIPAKYKNVPKPISDEALLAPKSRKPSSDNRSLLEKVGSFFSGGESDQQSAQGEVLDTMLQDTLDVARHKEGFTERNFLGIKIIGQKFFVARIEKALDMLVERAPYEFKRIRTYVNTIKQGKRTMMWTEVESPVMTISAKSATHTTTFTAGIIAHESCHARIAQEGRSADPADYAAIQQEEKECIAYEEKVMREIGAPPQEMKMLREQDGTHFDVNQDGKYDLDDFSQMDW
jgi:hypothetical protein